MTFDGTLPHGWDISSRLMARWTFEDGSTIEVDSTGTYRLEDSEGNEFKGSDFHPSPLTTGWPDILGAFVGFLSADAETYASRMTYGEPEDGYLFGEQWAEWAYMRDDELSMLSLELEALNTREGEIR